MKRLALAFVGVAAIFALLWSLDLASWIDALAPNAITESLAIALALTVIDRFVRKRDLARITPLVDYTLDTIDLGVHSLASTIVFDYHHRHRDPEQMPTGVLDCIQFWLDRQSSEDVPALIKNSGRWPYPAGMIAEFAESTYRLTEENRHDLIAADTTNIVLASKHLATSISLLAAKIDAEEGAEATEIGSLSAEDASARHEARDRENRRSAITAGQRFLQVYDGGRGGRPPLTIAAPTFETALHFRQTEAASA